LITRVMTVTVPGLSSLVMVQVALWPGRSVQGILEQGSG
jgi:hypothetical protein